MEDINKQVVEVQYKTIGDKEAVKAAGDVGKALSGVSKVGAGPAQAAMEGLSKSAQGSVRSVRLFGKAMKDSFRTSLSLPAGEFGKIDKAMASLGGTITGFEYGAKADRYNLSIPNAKKAEAAQVLDDLRKSYLESLAAAREEAKAQKEIADAKKAEAATLKASRSDVSGRVRLRDFYKAQDLFAKYGATNMSTKFENGKVSLKGSVSNENAEKLAQELAKVTEEGNRADKALSKIGKNKGLKTAAGNARSAASSLERLVALVKRIILYRAIRSALREIATAFKEGTQNAYQFSRATQQAFGHTFANNMDKIATSVLFMKNALGAAVSTILNALTPAITAMADAVANFANTLSGFFAALSGQDHYLTAKKNAYEYADAANLAAKAHKQLLGFDELNILSEKGGGKNDEKAWKENFNVNSTEEFVNQMKEKISNLPEEISNALTDGMDGLKEKIADIDWSQLPYKLWNGMMDAIRKFKWSEVFGSAGELIGTAIAAAVKFTVAAVTLIAKKLGEAIKEHFTDSEGNVEIDLGKLFTFDPIGQWVKKNITDPFILGVVNGITGGDYSSIKEAFQDKIARPAKEKFMEISESWWATETQLLEGFRQWRQQAGEDIRAFVENIIEKVKEFGRKVYLELVWKTATIEAEIKHWWQQGPGKWFTAEFWQEKFDVITNAWDEMKKKIEQSPIIATIKTTLTSFGESVKGLSGLFATGGYPDTGSMFIAGEAGPELVGNINGRTGVINNDQFGAIVATAAENIINAILSSGASVADAAREGGEIYMDSTLVSRSLISPLDRERSRMGGSAIEFVGA